MATELELSDCGRNVDSLPELAPDCGVKQLDLLGWGLDKHLQVNMSDGAV